MTIEKKRTSPLAHSLKMLESRWANPDDNLVRASNLAAVWVRMKGVEAPVRFHEPLTLARIAALGIEKWAPLAHTDELNEREFQIFCDLARGLKVSEIAKTRFLSVKTVSTYRSRIVEKSGLRNNAEMAVYAASVGLVKWDQTRAPGATTGSSVQPSHNTGAAAQA